MQLYELAYCVNDILQEKKKSKIHFGLIKVVTIIRTQFVG